LVSSNLIAASHCQNVLSILYSLRTEYISGTPIKPVRLVRNENFDCTGPDSEIYCEVRSVYLLRGSKCCLCKQTCRPTSSRYSILITNHIPNEQKEDQKSSVICNHPLLSLYVLRLKPNRRQAWFSHPRHVTFYGPFPPYPHPPQCPPPVVPPAGPIHFAEV